MQRLVFSFKPFRVLDGKTLLSKRKILVIADDLHMCLVIDHQYLIKNIEYIVDLFCDQYSQYPIETKQCRTDAVDLNSLSVFDKIY